MLFSEKYKFKMDALKNKLAGRESPEEMNSRMKKLWPLNISLLAISIVMVVIGAMVC